MKPSWLLIEESRRPLRGLHSHGWIAHFHEDLFCALMVSNNYLCSISFYVQLSDYSILLKLIHVSITLQNHGLMAIMISRLKNKSGNFFSPLGFEPWSPVCYQWAMLTPLAGQKCFFFAFFDFPLIALDLTVFASCWCKKAKKGKIFWFIPMLISHPVKFSEKNISKTF